MPPLPPPSSPPSTLLYWLRPNGSFGPVSVCSITHEQRSLCCSLWHKQYATVTDVCQSVPCCNNTRTSGWKLTKQLIFECDQFPVPAYAQVSPPDTHLKSAAPQAVYGTDMPSCSKSHLCRWYCMTSCKYRCVDVIAMSLILYGVMYTQRTCRGLILYISCTGVGPDSWQAAA